MFVTYSIDCFVIKSESGKKMAKYAEINDSIFFSIIAPAYKDAFLKEGIESVLAQSYDNYEIILVDDGSKDKTASVCDGFAEKTKKIQVFHKENSGVLNTRLFALTKASGDWVVFIDDDDRMKPDELSILADKIREYKSADCIIFGFDTLSEDNGTWSSHKVSESVVEKDVYSEDKDFICSTVFTGATYMCIWRKAVRRTSLGIGISPPEQFERFRNFGDDTFQTVEILRRCNNFLFIPDSLYEYRVGNYRRLTGAVKFPENKISFFRELYVINYLQTEKQFTELSFDKYRSFLRQSLFTSLVEVATSLKSLKQKLEWYNQYRENDNFYDSFLASTYGNYYFEKYKIKALHLLEKRHYLRLLFYCILRKIISIVKREPLDVIS